MKHLFGCCILLSFFSIKAQVFEGADAEKRLRGSELIKLNEHNLQVQYALLKTDFIIPQNQVLPYFNKVYNLDAAYTFGLIREEKDEMGFVHLRYQQFYNGKRVIGGTLIAHIKNKQLHSFNGEIYKIVAGADNSTLSENECLRIALDTLKGKVYKWQLSEEESFLKEIKNDLNATWFPKGELVYCPTNLNYNQPAFQLAFQYSVYANEPLIGELIFVSPINGQVIARENRIHTTNVNGQATTKYSGSQAINTDSTAPGNYRLRETVRGNGVTTLNLKTSTNYGTAVDFTDADNKWNNVNAAKDEVATDCHWGAGKTYDFYKVRFNRNSYDNNNAKITSYVHYSSSYDNAFWNGVCMTYGDGNTFKPLTSLDVCGHEITHAVTSNSANLNYSYESGALNESFSDMFGNAIERYGKPNNYSWKIGEEITYSGNGLRNMLNPTILGQPRCYKSTYWYTGAGDNGGVHTNSGVQNWWFYLISEGGKGTNDLGNVYAVDSLGILKAEQIAYRNLTVYLTSTSQYADARFYSIRAATDLYGACSKEVIAVTNAWYACNVGAKYDSSFVKAAFIADTVVCSKSKQVNFTNMSTNVVSANWYFGDGNTSTTFNPTYTYSNFGSFTIKLVSTSCFKNKKDSLTKTAYVKIDSTADICNAVLMPQSGNDSTHKCFSFVYDDGGEGTYKTQNITNYRISAPGADSIRIKFLDFDYELNYDSLYVYKGKYPGGTKLGGFTGSTLPFAGKNYTVVGSMITLRHVSDQLETGRGFKMYYTAFKKAVTIKAYADTTICYGNSTLLYSKGKGGYVGDYFFQWKNLVNKDSVIVAPVVLTTYKSYLTDVCTKSKDSAQVTVTVRSPLKVSVTKDTIICAGQAVNIKATPSGGKNTTYQYVWNNGLGSNSSYIVTPLVTTTYRVILKDGCSPKSDTAFVTITVKSPLKVKIATNDTQICYNKTASFTASASGGVNNYVYTWNNALGTGSNKSINLLVGTLMKVTVTDGCTVKPATDSVFVKVSSKLVVNLNNDSTICKGSNIALNASSNGGVVKNYTYTWNQGLPSLSSNLVKPLVKTKYFVTLKDNCSDDATDSITVDVLQALKIKGVKDSTICQGQSVTLNTIVSGGKMANYRYTWSNGLSNSSSQLVSPANTTIYRVILSDGCTVINDTSFIKIIVNSPLTIQLNSIDTVICYNKMASLNAIAKGGNGNYTFTWNNALGVGANKSIQLTNNAWLKVTVTDACTVLPASDSILIKVRTPLMVSLNNDSTICKGTFINLLASAKGGNVANYVYAWSPALPALSNNTVNPSILTKYFVTLKDNCSDDAKDSIIVDVLPGLSIKGLVDTTICFGGTASFNPVVSGGKSSQYTYQWSQGLGNNPQQQASPKTRTVYKMAVRDNCTNPYDSISLTVFVRPPLKISKTLSSNTICNGDSVQLSLLLTGGIAAQYNWTINGSNGIGNSVYLKPNIKTHYDLKLNDNCSESDTTGFDIVVNPLPIVDFDADKKSICQYETVQFINNTTGASVYAWKFSANDKSIIVSPNFTYRQTGVFDVTLSATSSAGCKAVLSKSSFINVVKLASGKFVFTPDDATYLNPDITFTNQSADYTSFLWDFGDGKTENSLLSPMHTYPDTGRYKVKLTVVNSLGCIDVYEAYVNIKDVYALYIPTAISVNSDGLNDELQIIGRGAKKYDYSIFNRWGEKVFESSNSGPSFKALDTKGDPLIKGTYLLVMTVKDFSGKVYYIKQTLEIL